MIVVLELRVLLALLEGGPTHQDLLIEGFLECGMVGMEL